MEVDLCNTVASCRWNRCKQAVFANKIVYGGIKCYNSCRFRGDKIQFNFIGHSAASRFEGFAGVSGTNSAE
jgi:hypothetical protein